MDELSNRLRAAPREADPPRDLWPDVAGRISGHGSGQGSGGWRRAAAVLLIFGAGTYAGVMLERAAPSEPEGPAAPAGSPLHAAAAVQRTGSEYLLALARLRELDVAEPALRAQGYEAALGVLAVTAHEVAAAMDLEEHDALLMHALSARAAVSRRVSGLIRRGGG